MKLKVTRLLFLSVFLATVIVACEAEDETRLNSMSTPTTIDTHGVDTKLETKVQSLEKDIAVLTEQLVQAQAVNKELENEIAALKASAVPTPTQTPIPAEPTYAEPVKGSAETTKVKVFPNWIPMTVESDRVIQQIHEGRQDEWLLFSISNPNDEMGFLEFHIVAIGDSGYKLSDDIGGPISDTAYHASVGQYFPAKSETFRLINRTYFDDRKLPSKWEVAVDYTNNRWDYKIISIDDGVLTGGFPASREIKGIEGNQKLIPIDPYDNEFIEIDGDYVANKAETSLLIMYYCDNERPKSEDVPRFENYPQYSKNQYSYMNLTEIAPETKIVDNNLKQVNQPRQGEILTCHSWQVMLPDG